MQNIKDIRLLSQLLYGSDLVSPREVVAWMGAMQAQDYNMAKWAVGIRLKSATEQLVEEALNRGEILRTHVMRPTWHFVAQEDIRWMLRLSAQRIKSSSVSRDRALEITEDLYSKCNDLLVRILEGNNFLTREEVGMEFKKAGIAVNTARMIHFMMRAEVEGIVCSGPVRNKKLTYALIEERVAPVKELHKDEALAKLALNYFRSHSPASLQDFIWWSGLSVADAKQAIASIETELISEKFASQELFIHQLYAKELKVDKVLHLLPGFDEYIISYKDRTSVVASEHQSKAFTNNGTFYPTIMCNGQVVGVWKKSVLKTSIKIDTTFFEQTLQPQQKALAKAENVYLKYLGLPVSK
ncbi:winged helix DNA-binding domain-containing protein [uncultured Bacteroides sp.]|uniref:winged helix DNA-binding domain-containing protein n=1 Tax=uncultured Bacteroides sp. TaxID=162156 RepID=UPI002AABE386|nr:winged helix DNA-binding domain-containing protein [uncultured Bacteroides sp.]